MEAKNVPILSFRSLTILPLWLYPFFYRVTLVVIFFQILLPAELSAQLNIELQPVSISTCQPAGNTDFTTSMRVGRGNGCGNLSTAANVTFIWEYFNGSSWVAVSANTPAGFSYAAASVRTGTGSGAVITSTLTITLSASASVGVFQFRVRANQPTGCSAFVTSNTFTVTVFAKPVPTFTSQPGAAACTGQTLTYATQAGNSAYTWGVPGVQGTDFIITGGSLNSETVSLQWLTTGSKTVTVNYTNANGCTAAAPVSSIATTVSARPAPSFTAQPAGSVCTGIPVIYTTQPGQTAYQWTIPGIAGTDYLVVAGGTGNTDHTVTLEWLSPGSKQVQINYTNTAGCAGIAATNSATITVNSRPLPSFLQAPAAVTCGLAAVTYATQPGQTNYQWTVPGTAGTDYLVLAGGTGSTDPTVTLQWLTGGNKAVSVNYTASNGCTGINPAVSNTTVDIPAVPLISAGGPTAFCNGGSVLLTASSGTAYQWFLNGNPVTGAQASAFSASLAGTYTVQVTDAAGCNALSAGTLITIHPQPSLVFSGSAVPVCADPAMQVTALAYSATSGSPVTYSLAWGLAALGAGFTDVPSTAFPTSPVPLTIPPAAPAAVYSGQLTIANAQGCSDMYPFTVEVKTLPDLSGLLLTVPDICAGQPAGVTVNAPSLADGSYTVTYDLTGANPVSGLTATILVSGGSAQFQTPALMSAGAGNVILTYLEGTACGTTPVSGINASFTVHALPLVQPISGPTGVCLGSSIQLTNNTPGGTWSSDHPAVAAVNPAGLVNGLTTGNTVVRYALPADANGCSNSAAASVEVYGLPSAAPVTGPSAVCAGSTINLSNAIPGGTWKSGNVSVAIINSAGTVTGVAAGSALITYIVPANVYGCTDSVSYNLTVDAPPAASAGSAVTVCQSATPAAILLSGASVNSPATTGAWSVISGSGVLSSTGQTATPASVTFTPAAGFSGTVQLQLTTNTPNSCNAGTSIRTIQVNAASLVTAGPTLNACQSAAPGAITLNGASFSGGATAAAWSIVSGGGTLSNTGQTANPAGITYTPAAGFSGTAVLRLTTNALPGCGTVTADRNVLVTAAPVVQAGSGVLTCGDISQTASGTGWVNITAGATAVNTTGVLWTSSGTGTFTNANSLTLAQYLPSAADIAAGSVILTLTATGNSPCGNVSAVKTLTITPGINLTDANSWVQTPNCNGLGVQFSLPAAPGGGNGTFSYQWFSKNNCGVAGVSTPIPGATGPVHIPTDNNCYWLQISSGGCMVPRNLVAGTNRQRPDANVANQANINFGINGTNNQLCTGSSVTLTASSAVSYTYSWSPATGLSATTGASVVANPSTTTVYTVTATATDGTGCTRTALDTVTVYPQTVAGTLPALVNGCAGMVSLPLTGFTGAVTNWESSTDGGTNWSGIAQTASTLNISLATTATRYRARVQSGVCPAAYSTVSLAAMRNVWAGNLTSNWQQAANWSDGQLPDLGCPDVIIPTGVAIMPQLNSGTATINNLVIQPAASLTVSGGLLQLAGSITNNGNLDMSAGSLELNGSVLQTLAGSVFSANTVNELIVSNPAGLEVSNLAGVSLNIRSRIGFGNVNNSFVQTGDNLVLLSSATGTASVADLTNNGVNTGNVITGKVEIQRYIPGRRAWRLLSAPVTAASGLTIHNTWQEGAVPVTNPSVITPVHNPNPGYGTHVTFGFPATNGYDQGINGNTSIRYLTSTGWTGVPSATNNGALPNTGRLSDQPGYMLFVRGDRSTPLSAGVAAVVSPTVLRMKGFLHTGAVDIPLHSGFTFGSSRFRVVGNPYPSAVSFHKLMQHPNNQAGSFEDAFYSWDATLTGTNGVGGWVALSYNTITGQYDRTVLGGGTTGVENTGNIQSGSAIVIDYPGTATSLRLEEPHKVNGSSNGLFRPVGQQQALRIQLIAKNPDQTESVNDAVLVTFSEQWEDAVTRADMKKLNNFSENLAIRRDSSYLVLERRAPLQATDSVCLGMGQMRTKGYVLAVDPEQLRLPEGSYAVLEDRFLQQRTPLPEQAGFRYDFSVNSQAGSSRIDRFNILVQPVAVFTELAAQVKEQDVQLNWRIASRLPELSAMEIQRSADGTQFETIGSISPSGTLFTAASFTHTDLQPGTGNWYYRVRAVASNGVAVVSELVKATVLSPRQGLNVYPNPVSGQEMQLRFSKVKAGRYRVLLMDAAGRQLQVFSLVHAGGSQTSRLPLQQPYAPGMYRLLVTDINGRSETIPVMIGN